MKIKVNTSNQIKIVPDEFKDEKKPPTFIFQLPNANTNLNFLMEQNFSKWLCDCFVGFDNKIDLEDSNGEAIEYGTYQEFISISHPLINSIHQQCFIKFSEEVKSMQMEASKIEKKSKSAGKSSKGGS